MEKKFNAISGYHFSTDENGSIVLNASKIYYWLLPNNLVGKIKMGDIVRAQVKGKDGSLKCALVIVKEVFDNFEKPEGQYLKYVVGVAKNRSL